MEVVDNIKTHFMSNKFFPKSCGITWKTWQSQTGHRWKHSTMRKWCYLHAR